jgi:glycosyltransferase involved in cell wall biosynthesis
MRWFFVTTEFPWPIIHGRWLRVYHLAKELVAAGDEVSILGPFPTTEGRDAYRSIGVDVAAGPSGPHRTSGRGRWLLAPYAFDAAMAGCVRQKTVDADVVVLCGSRMLQYAPEARAANATVLADLVDDPVLESRRRGRNGKGGDSRGGWFAGKGRGRYEAKALKMVDVVTFVSQEDCASFRDRHQGAIVRFVPNGVDVGYFDPAQAEGSANPLPSKSLVFLGLMSNPNNIRAAEFLINEVAPRIAEACADARVYIVGAEPPERLQALRSDLVEITGRVDDIRPYLWHAAAVVLPMQSGTGIKNKLLEAWAAGCPVVATPLACQGVDARDGQNLLLGQTAVEVTNGALRLLNDRGFAAGLGDSGRETVKALTWVEMAKELRECVMAAGVDAATEGSGVKGQV